MSRARYGDLLVFVDMPEGAALDLDQFNFRWIKHAAVFLFSGYVFSKGSKYPSSPYVIKSLSEEWKIWESNLRDAAVIGSRRKFKGARISYSQILPTWLY